MVFEACTHDRRAWRRARVPVSHPTVRGPVWRSTRSAAARWLPGRYRFQVIGEPDDDPLGCGQARRRDAPGPGSPHLEDTDHGPQVNDRLILRGTVDSDPDEDRRVPDSRHRWSRNLLDELGRMVAAFEGWQFRRWVSRPKRRVHEPGDRENAAKCGLIGCTPGTKRTNLHEKCEARPASTEAVKKKKNRENRFSDKALAICKYIPSFTCDTFRTYPRL